MPSKKPPKSAAARPDDATLEHLLASARAARERAHAPHSKLRVGSALLDAAGGVHVGCNVESASYGLTICAERNALARATADGAPPIVAAAVVSTKREPLLPCGACRQVLSELAPGALVVCEGESGARVERRVEELLPDAFGPDDLPGAGA